MPEHGFDYCRAVSVAEALALLAERPQSRFLGGGTDLLPRQRAGRAPFARLVDLKGIPALQDLGPLPDGGLSIGAAVTAARIAAHPLVRERFGALAACAGSLGSAPLRNRATLGGNLCNASPCADMAAALLCLDARLRIAGPGGERHMDARAFFLGPGQTALAPGELLVACELPAAAASARFRYHRLARRQAVDIATVAALVVRFAHGNHRIALLSVAPTPLRIEAAEAALDAGDAVRAAALARDGASPITDVRGTAEYRREMVAVLVRRAAAEL